MLLNTYYLKITCIVLATFQLACKESNEMADLIITNAVIWTGNEAQPMATDMAISSDSVMAVGDYSHVRKYKGNSTKIVNVKGNFITPGFIDTHVHLLMGGNALLSVELRNVSTTEEFIDRISDHAKKIEPGSWILEGNWDHTLWGGELPAKEWIDDYTQENPVALYRMDGHMILANSAALKIAGIDRNTPDVHGGVIVKDSFGNPTGILKGHAMIPVLEKIPALTEDEMINAIKAAQHHFLSNGVTSIHDMDSLGSYSAAKKMKDRGELLMRIYALNPLNNWSKRPQMELSNDKWLKTGGLKGFVDGSLGSHTAAFKEAYSDKSNDRGYFLNDEKELYQWIKTADSANFQVTVHGIGDRAVYTLLNIYQNVIEDNGEKDRRLRIEHAQHLDPMDIRRFAELGVIASMQPYHAIDDGRWAMGLIGLERSKFSYAFKSLIDANVKVAFGSDWPVAPASPLKGIYAAVTRRTLDGKNPDGWVPEQKINVEHALKAYTKNAAYSSFEERLKGSLEVGKLADFVILSDNLFKVDPVEIADVKILATYVGGQIVYNRNRK